MKKYIFLLIIILSILSVTATIKKENPYHIFIDAESATLYLLENGKVFKTYRCAPGKYSTPSPIGTLKIISKDTWGEGFGGRFMGINCPWGLFGIHGTLQPNSIGWHSSHGCIRMYNSDVKELYKIVPHGTPVTIEDGPFGVFGRGFRTIKPGMYGSDVMAIQKKLEQLGYSTGYIDGKYGIGMRNAIHKYQSDNSLYVSDTISVELIKHMGFVLME